MPRVGFESKIPVFGREKTFHALDRAATVISYKYYYYGSTTLRWGLAAFFFSFLILYAAGRTPWTGDQPVARPLPTQRTTNTE
jgi:hypothetical protein